MKTVSAASKRFKVTSTGILLRGHPNSRHLKSGKSQTNIARHKEPGKVYSKFAKKISSMLAA